MAADVRGRHLAEPAAVRAQWHHRLGHRPVPPGAAEIGEVPAHEFPRVLRVAEIPYRNHDGVVDDPRDDRPFDVFKLQEEMGGVRDEILPRERPEERAEDLIPEAAALMRLDHEIEP